MSLRALLLVTLALAGCRQPSPIFVCPVGEAGWNERRLAIEVLDASEDSGGFRVVGRVRDAETSEAVVGANALIVGTSRGTAVGDGGRFSLDSLGLDQIVRFGLVGYAQYELSVAELTGRTSPPPTSDSTIQTAPTLDSTAHVRVAWWTPTPARMASLANGRLAVIDGCLALAAPDDLNLLLVLPYGEAAWDSGTERLEYGGQTYNIGDEIRVGGGMVGRDYLNRLGEGPRVLPNCDLDNLFIVG